MHYALILLSMWKLLQHVCLVSLLLRSNTEGTIGRLYSRASKRAKHIIFACGWCQRNSICMEKMFFPPELNSFEHCPTQSNHAFCMCTWKEHSILLSTYVEGCEEDILLDKCAMKTRSIMERFQKVEQWDNVCSSLQVRLQLQTEFLIPSQQDRHRLHHTFLVFL